METQKPAETPQEYTPQSRHKSLRQALVAAKADFKKVLKEQENKHYGHSYADLNGYLESIHNAFTAHGLLLIQPITLAETWPNMVLSTIICFGEEQLISQMPLPWNDDSQKLGSRISYFRRYMVAATLGMSSEDDDAEGATRTQNSKTNVQKKLPTTTQKLAMMTEEQRLKIIFLLDSKFRVPNEIKAQAVEMLCRKSTIDLTDRDAAALIAHLEKKEEIPALSKFCKEYSQKTASFDPLPEVEPGAFDK